MKRLVLLVIPVAVLALACSPVTSAKTRISYIYLAGAEASHQLIVDITEAFHKQNPDIEVELMRVTTWDYQDKVVALFAAGKAPDVIAFHNNYAASFMDAGMLYDISGYVKASNFELSRFPAFLRNLFTWEGRYYGFPFRADPNVYTVNEYMIDEAGLEQPANLWRRDAWTWSEFRSTARKLTQKGSDGTWLRAGANFHTWATWVWSNGGDLVDHPLQPTRFRMNEEISIAALQFLQDLLYQDEGVMIQASGQFNWNQTVEMFVSGQIGMFSNWLSGLPQLASGGFGVSGVPYPKSPNPSGDYSAELGIWANGVASTSKHSEAAWRYVSFFTGDEGARIIYRKGAGAMPARIMSERLGWLPDNVSNAVDIPRIRDYGRIGVCSLNAADINKHINAAAGSVIANAMPARTAVEQVAEAAIAAISKR